MAVPPHRGARNHLRSFNKLKHKVLTLGHVGDAVADEFDRAVAHLTHFLSRCEYLEPPEFIEAAPIRLFGRTTRSSVRRNELRDTAITDEIVDGLRTLIRNGLKTNNRISFQTAQDVAALLIYGVFLRVMANASDKTLFQGNPRVPIGPSRQRMKG